MNQNPLELTLGQSFEKERFTRAINESSDVKELRRIATVLLNGWFSQRAATQWVMKQALQSGRTVKPEDLQNIDQPPLS